MRARAADRAVERTLPKGGPAAMQAAARPVAEALLDEARRRAAETVARARAEADAAVAAAHRRAETILDRARAAGRAEGAALAGADRADARDRARRLVLEARRRVYDELAARVREEMGDPALRPVLDAVVRHRLGPGAEIVPAPGGGVTGRAGGRELDLSAAALAEAALAALGTETEELWSPRSGA
ncbi:hypothetical protein [Actinomadura gamaensis]|uniref:Uncharacterized protein n=1 Tax=Actinomadura gamaensis TaxID=1763541 RepID=A0ABV9TSI3_9ACTN